jgi:hypothetical protein
MWCEKFHVAGQRVSVSREYRGLFWCLRSSIFVRIKCGCWTVNSLFQQPHVTRKHWKDIQSKWRMGSDISVITSLYPKTTTCANGSPRDISSVCCLPWCSPLWKFKRWIKSYVNPEQTLFSAIHISTTSSLTCYLTNTKFIYICILNSSFLFNLMNCYFSPGTKKKWFWTRNPEILNIHWKSPE